MTQIIDTNDLDLYQDTVKAETCYKENLNSPYKIIQPQLMEYLRLKGRETKSILTLHEILKVITDTIETEKLFDQLNPGIIMCNHALEKAIDRKALHIAQLPGIILKLLSEVQPPSDEGNMRSTQQPSGTTQRDSAHQTRTHYYPGLISRNIGMRDKCQLSMRLKAVLITLTGDTENTNIFRDVVEHTCRYIGLNRESFIDPRNTEVAILGDDPLGRALDVRAFHFSQLPIILQKQVIKIENNSVHTHTNNSATTNQQHWFTTIPFDTEDVSDDTPTTLEEVLELSEPSEYEISSSEAASEANYTSKDKHDTESNPEEPKHIEVVKITNSDIYSGDVETEESHTSKEKQDNQNKLHEKRCFTCPQLSVMPFCTTCWISKRDWIPKRIKCRKRLNKDNLTQEKILVKKPIIKRNINIVNNDTNQCIICVQHPRNASFIHGRSAHQSCCYGCARKIWKEAGRCPNCRLKIEKIVKNFG